MGFFTKSELARRGKRAVRTASTGFAGPRTAKELIKQATKSYSKTDTFDIFLSHRFIDFTQLKGLVDELQDDFGLEVYIDHIIDDALERGKANRDTARLIRRRMKQCRSLLFATTENALESVWTPWELGYFDGTGRPVAIMPVFDDDPGGNEYKGSEYLGIYPWVRKDQTEGSNVTRLYVWETETRWAEFQDWSEGGGFTEWVEG